MIATGYRIEGIGPRWVALITGIANDLTMWDGQMPALAVPNAVHIANIQNPEGFNRVLEDFLT